MVNEKEINYIQLKKLADNPSKAESMEATVAKHTQDLKDYREELRKVNSILVAGVIVLLVMVATLMVMIVINYITSFDNYTNARTKRIENEYQILQLRIDKLENISSSNAK